MKRAIIAIEKMSDLNEDLKADMEHLASKFGAEVMGATCFPRGTVFTHPEIIVDVVKNHIEADLILATTPEFFINELINDNSFTKLADKVNLKVIQADLEMELKDIMHHIPTEMKKELNEFIKQDDPFQGFTEEHEETVLLLSKEEASPKTKEYINKLRKEGVVKFNQITIPEYFEEMGEAIKHIIVSEAVDRVLVCDEYESPAFNRLMKELDIAGIEIEYMEGIDIEMTNYRMSMYS